MIPETFKPVNEFPKYNIGCYGTVIGTKGVKMTPYSNQSGYLKVSLTINNKSVNRFIHRLVAIAFIPNPLNLKFVNHLDGNKQNNIVSNLEWCTHKQNMQHATNILNNMQFLKVNPIARKLTEPDVIVIKKTLKVLSKTCGGDTKQFNNGLIDIADKYNVHVQTIKCIMWGKTWKMIQ